MPVSRQWNRPNAGPIGVRLCDPVNDRSREGFRMPAGRDLSGAEGRRPKAPEEGTRGGLVGGLRSMGIWSGRGFGE